MIVLLSCTILYFMIIILPPFLHWIFSMDYPIRGIINDLLDLFFILMKLIIPAGLFLGYLAEKLSTGRLYKLSLAFVVIYCGSVFLVMFEKSNFPIFNLKEWSLFVVVLIWMIVSHLFISFPLILSGAFVFERWTKK